MGLCGKMPKTLVFQLLIGVIFNFILSVHTLEVDLTVDVKPGHEECFYEEIKKPTSLEVEYQVGLTFLQSIITSSKSSKNECPSIILRCSQVYIVLTQ